MTDLTGKGKPFHSMLDKGAALLKRKVGTGAEFMQELKGLGGIKQSEIDERKLGEIMGMPRMTHDQFMANLSIRPTPPINEEVLDEDQAHHEKWTLPGGENYREMLIKSPNPREGMDYQRYELDSKLRRAAPENRSAIMRQMDELREKYENAPEVFEGVLSHFGGESGILASMRLKDRTGPNGEKLLHLEELQSDWHQKGREGGYGNQLTPEDSKRVEELQRMSSNGGMSMGERAEWAGLINKREGAVPDAPFKKNWEEMALKRLVHHAAEKGYHGIVVTPGAEQADRYGLAKHIGMVSYHPEEQRFQAFKPNRETVINEKGATPERVAELIGKDAAERLLKAPKAGDHHFLEGEDFNIGGEGMKGFYDKKVPNILNGIGKKYGVKTQLNGHQLKISDDLNFPPNNNNLPQHVPGETRAVHHFPITEDMRKDVLTNGLPLYAEGGIIHKAQGGTVLPSLEQMKTALMKQAKPNFNDMRNIGANEAPGMSIKAFVPPTRTDQGQFPVGGISMGGDPLPMGGVDMSMGQPGNQLMPNSMMAPQGGPPQGGMPAQGDMPGGQPPPMGGSNILQMTPQGQAMAAMKPTGMAMGGSVATLGQLTGAANSPSVPQMAQGGLNPNPLPAVIKYGDSMNNPADNENMDNGALNYSIDNPQLLAKGGSAKTPSLDQMKKELDESDEPEEKAPSKRITIKAEGPGGVTGIVVPHHMLHGRSWVSKKTGKVVKVAGMADINKARAEVYGAENRDPLSIGQIGRIHKSTLEDHFAKPMKEQLASEQAAMKKLRAAKHLGEKANTLDKSEKLDTVNHEEDEKGRNYIGFASKGVAGHALYSSGHGKNLKHHVINTCPGQTSGCGGGTDANGVVDTSKGTCFAPNAESQYVHAAVRRATHEQAKHDPAMTKDWILSHTGSMRHAAKLGDKSNKVLLFRPNVVDETDVSSRHVIRHLNEQRKVDDKPPIIANSYGKTNELHDPENGYYVTHSNVGPKVKKGESIAENIARDKSRVRSTIRAADAGGKDTVNEQGNKTPPKNSYMVTDVKRNSPLSKKMESSITHAKYWSTGREDHELTAAEKEEGSEGHFGGNGKPTSEDKAHYGHTTLGDKRYDYQRQHILHPRLVQVGKNKDGTPHMIPTDSRFKDEEFLPKSRYKTKNGKNAGAIVMTTPTESTSNIGHDTSFTHHVNDSHVEHAKNSNGEYQIDKPEDQRKAEGKEYSEPRPITIRRAEGGSVGGSDDRGDDEFHAFPEQNGMAQRHLTMRHDQEEADEIGHLPFAAKSQVTAPKSGKVKFHNDMDTINLELSLNRKKAK